MTITLRERAEGLAAAQCLSIHDGITWQQAYDELQDCADNGTEPTTFLPWEPFENWDLDVLADHIAEEADTILEELKQATQPLVDIQAVLSGFEWSPNMTDEVTQILIANGYPVEEP